MSSFTSTEIAYMNGQRLGRLASLNKDGSPHVVPVSFRYNPDLDTIDIGGLSTGKSKKFRDVARDGRVAFVIDDVLPPWQPRGIEIRGAAQALPEGGKSINKVFDDELIRIKPTHLISWGIDGSPHQPNSRKVDK